MKNRSNFPRSAIWRSTATPAGCMLVASAVVAPAGGVISGAEQNTPRCIWRLDRTCRHLLLDGLLTLRRRFERDHCSRWMFFSRTMVDPLLQFRSGPCWRERPGRRRPSRRRAWRSCFPHARRSEHGVDLAVEHVDDRLGRPGRREQAEPDHGVEAGQPGFRNRRARRAAPGSGWGRPRPASGSCRPGDSRAMSTRRRTCNSSRPAMRSVSAGAEPR